MRRSTLMDRWYMAQDGKTRGKIFHDEMDRGRESQGSTTACSNLSVTGRTKERVAQSKRARTGLLSLKSLFPRIYDIDGCATTVAYLVSGWVFTS